MHRRGTRDAWRPAGKGRGSGRRGGDGLMIRALQDQIKQLIIDRGLQPGDPLPTEEELCALFGSGRNSTREAIKSLQALDVVEVRHGYGTTVGSMSLDPLVNGLSFRVRHGLRQSQRGLHDLLEVRMELEAALIRKATPLLTEEDLDALDQLADELEQAARSGDSPVEVDRRFHQIVYRPLGNALVLELIDAFWLVYQRGTLGRINDPVDAARWHRAIVASLRARDADAAERALREHFGKIPDHLALLAGTREREERDNETSSAGRTDPP
jgi:DNA-binding FadR family transcriptional regulator